MRESNSFSWGIKDFVYTEEFIPRFRDADEDGLIGARGYFNLFQDLTSAHMFLYDLGNDVLSERTGCAWIFTKYRLSIYKKADFTKPLRIRTWVEPQRSPLLVYHDISISILDKDKEIKAAEGRVESCPFNLREQKLEKLSRIGYTGDISHTEAIPLSFSRFSRKNEGTVYGYTHKVIYTDLDKSEHMNNIKYIDMFLNTFDSAFYKEFSIEDIEIQYINQCFEGEEIKIFYEIIKDVQNGEKREKIRLIAVKEDGTTGSAALMTVSEKPVQESGSGIA